MSDLELNDNTNFNYVSNPLFFIRHINELNAINQSKMFQLTDWQHQQDMAAVEVQMYKAVVSNLRVGTPTVSHKIILRGHKMINGVGNKKKHYSYFLLIFCKIPDSLASSGSLQIVKRNNLQGNAEFPSNYSRNFNQISSRLAKENAN